MLRDITVGQYYSNDSKIHRLDPRVKIRFTIVYIFLAVIDRNFMLFGMLTAFLAVAVALSKVPAGHMLKGTRGLFGFIILCSMVNIFTTAGSTFVSIGGIDITKEGVIKAAFIVWRMVLIIYASSLLMYTTTPTVLTDGLEKCFHLPSDIAMGITIALRFLPILFEELDTILKAQEARGSKLHDGTIRQRFKCLGQVITPLFRNSLKRAKRLGEAMDSRCYQGGKKRLRLNQLKYESADYIAYFFILGMLVDGIFLAVKF